MPSDHKIIKLKICNKNNNWTIPKYLEIKQVKQSAPEHAAAGNLDSNPLLFHMGALAFTVWLYPFLILWRLLTNCKNLI